MKTALLLIASCALCTVASAEIKKVTPAATSDVVVGKVPGWKITRSKDSMTDKTSCIVYSLKYTNVFINTDSINVWMKEKGGVDAYQYRFDDDKATGMTPRMEGFDNINYWKNQDMEKVLGGKRLLVRIMPVIGRLEEYDIDLSHAKEAHEILTGSKCI